MDDRPITSQPQNHPPARPAKRGRGCGAMPSSTDADLHGKKDKKVPLSCAECRRLKLKCDRTFPCKSCRKRGCPGICPDGALVTGKGSRFILANTEQLHEKIIQMGERIRDLEDALQIFDETHALLRPELLLVKSSLELHGLSAPSATPSVGSSTTEPKIEDDDTPGTLTSNSFGKQTFYGRTARTEYLIPDIPEDYSQTDAQSIPDDIVELSRSFPVPWTVATSDVTRRRIRGMLPLRSTAIDLCEQARQNALWSYDPDPSGALIPELLHHVYTVQTPELSPHKLALLFMFLAIGSLVDLNQSPESPEAEKYHVLARAALCEASVIEETSLVAIQALFFMTWYLVVFSDRKKAVEYASGLMGLNAKLSQSIGLHCDSTSWNIAPDEMQRRRTLLWELMFMDVRLSLFLGRPTTFSLQYVNPKRPVYDIDSTETRPLTSYYHEWKHGFFTQCLSPVVETTVSVKPVKYSQIINLDCMIRDYPVPPMLRMVLNSTGSVSVAPTRSLAMQQALLTGGRHITILQLHRRYFTDALSGPEVFSLKHKYAPSVLATYRSACGVISTIQVLYYQEPQLSTRFAFFWSDAFTAAMSLCLLVSRAPSSLLASTALDVIEKTCQMLTAAGPYSRKAANFLPVLQKFGRTANRLFTKWQEGSNPLNPEDEDEVDELTVLYRGHSPIAPNRLPSPAVYTQNSNPFDHVHPSLLRYFEMQLPEGGGPPQMSFLPPQQQQRQDARFLDMLDPFPPIQSVDQNVGDYFPYITCNIPDGGGYPAATSMPQTTTQADYLIPVQGPDNPNIMAWL